MDQNLPSTPQGDSDKLDKLKKEIDKLGEKAKKEIAEKPLNVAAMKPAPAQQQQVPAQAAVAPQTSNQQVVNPVAPVEGEGKGKKVVTWVIIGLLLVALGVAGYFFFTGNLNKKEPTPTPTSTSAPTLDPTTNWEVYTNTEFGFSLKHPLGGTLSSLTEKGGTGEQVCITHSGDTSGLVSSVFAGGGACGDDTFLIGLLSSDYSAGRSAGFSDNLGYVLEDGGAMYIPTFGEKIEIPNTLISVVRLNNIDMLKVLGDTTEESTPFPVRGTPGEGRVGAIINTANEDYPSITIEANLEKVDEEMFDLILSTFEFEEAIFSPSPSASPSTSPVI